VSLIVGDPARYLHKIAGPFEIVVQTGAEPMRFAVLHERLIALLKPGGALITYNLARAADYNEKLIADPRLETVNADLNLGVAISWLRRP
jgi:hypothetical protein